MIDSWIVTVIFVATAAYAIVRATTLSGRVAVASQVLHAAMAVAMIAMTWLPQPGWLGWLQLGGFLGAGGWYLLPGVRGRCDRHAALTHAVMMFGMAWMVAVMIIRPAGSTVALAGIAVLVAFLVAGSRQAVELMVPVVARRSPVPRRPARWRREFDGIATLLMVLGMIIMTVPMLAVDGA